MPTAVRRDALLSGTVLLTRSHRTTPAAHRHSHTSSPYTFTVAAPPTAATRGCTWFLRTRDRTFWPGRWYTALPDPPPPRRTLTPQLPRYFTHLHACLQLRCCTPLPPPAATYYLYCRLPPAHMLHMRLPALLLPPVTHLRVLHRLRFAALFCYRTLHTCVRRAHLPCPAFATLPAACCLPLLSHTIRSSRIYATYVVTPAGSFPVNALSTRTAYPCPTCHTCRRLHTAPRCLHYTMDWMWIQL